jgi:hypothetical protein
MDADLQDSPDEIPQLRAMLLDGKYDLISGWKKKRFDNTLTKNVPSKFFNAVTRQVSKIPLHDFNCGLKAYRKKVVKSIEVYGEMHRYIPEDWRESSSAPAPEIRRYQIWLGAFCKRLSGSDFHIFCGQIFQTAHALLRFVGHCFFYHWPGYYPYTDPFQNIRCFFCTHQQTRLLLSPCRTCYWHAIVLSGLYIRARSPKRAGAQRVPH